MTTALPEQLDIVYGTLTEEDIAKIGLVAAREAFKVAVKIGLTKEAPDLHVRVAIEASGDEPDLREAGELAIGAGAKYGVNTRIDTGKLSTVATYRADTDQFVWDVEPDFKKNDPRGWMGGVIDVGRFKSVNGQLALLKYFGVACSGVEGAVDRFVSKAAAAAMAAAWILDMKARYDLAA